MMFFNCLFDVPLDEKLLVNRGHLFYHLIQVEGGRQSHKSLHCGAVGLDQISRQVVGSEAGAHHINWCSGVSVFYNLQCFFELVEVQSCEGDGTRHLATDSTTVQADTSEAIDPCFLNEDLNVIHLTATCESVHHEEDRSRCLGLILFEFVSVFPQGFRPVQGNMASIMKENFLPFVVKVKFWLTDVVHNLQEGVGEVEGRVVEPSFGVSLGKEFGNVCPLQDGIFGLLRKLGNLGLDVGRVSDFVDVLQKHLWIVHFLKQTPIYLYSVIYSDYTYTIKSDRPTISTSKSVFVLRQLFRQLYRLNDLPHFGYDLWFDGLLEVFHGVPLRTQLITMGKLKLLGGVVVVWQLLDQVLTGELFVTILVDDDVGVGSIFTGLLHLFYSFKFVCQLLLRVFGFLSYTWTSPTAPPLYLFSFRLGICLFILLQLILLEILQIFSHSYILEKLLVFVYKLLDIYFIDSLRLILLPQLISLDVLYQVLHLSRQVFLLACRGKQVVIQNSIQILRFGFQLILRLLLVRLRVFLPYQLFILGILFGGVGRIPFLLNFHLIPSQFTHQSVRLFLIIVELRKQCFIHKFKPSQCAFISLHILNELNLLFQLLHSLFSKLSQIGCTFYSSYSSDIYFTTSSSSRSNCSFLNLLISLIDYWMWFLLPLENLIISLMCLLLVLCLRLSLYYARFDRIFYSSTYFYSGSIAAIFQASAFILCLFLILWQSLLFIFDTLFLRISSQNIRLRCFLISLIRSLASQGASFSSTFCSLSTSCFQLPAFSFCSWVQILAVRGSCTELGKKLTLTWLLTFQVKFRWPFSLFSFTIGSHLSMLDCTCSQFTLRKVLYYFALDSGISILPRGCSNSIICLSKPLGVCRLFFFKLSNKFLTLELIMLCCQLLAQIKKRPDSDVGWFPVVLHSRVESMVQPLSWASGSTQGSHFSQSLLILVLGNECLSKAKLLLYLSFDAQMVETECVPSVSRIFPTQAHSTR